MATEIENLKAMLQTQLESERDCSPIDLTLTLDLDFSSAGPANSQVGSEIESAAASR